MTDLFNAGLELMLVGMGIVFLFLALLVVAVNAMSYVLRRYFPETPQFAHRLPDSGVDTGTAAAIAAALHRYRAARRS
ncbi:MAG: OadG family protein [Gammaproteobacteria bacterium]